MHYEHFIKIQPTNFRYILHSSENKYWWGAGGTFLNDGMAFYVASLVFILFALGACIWTTRGGVFLHTSDMSWHLTCWSMECVK